MAAQLPGLYSRRGVRAAIDDLPLLAAGADDLADSLLWRAATVLGVLAHAYARCESGSSPEPPLAVQRPWAEVCRRLGRRFPFLAYDDLIAANWRMVDDRAPEPLRAGNLRLLAPTVDNSAERIFYLTQVEMLWRAAPVVGAVVDAQEAAVDRDVERLSAALMTMIDSVRAMIESFSAISPNQHSPTNVDPVLWATTVAPLAAPLEPGGPGPSGLATPSFHLFDVFLQRPSYESALGVEAGRLRAAMPRRQRKFLDAVSQVSVPDLIAGSGDPRLNGLMRELLEAFAGEEGCLGAHRRKVYGYLTIAFKVGRSLTVRGFSDDFADRAWKEVDSELDASRVERDLRPEQFLSKAAVAARERAAGPDSPITQVTVDIAGSGLRYRRGDRLRVLAYNDPLLVDRAVVALSATGTEFVALTRAWRAALGRRGHPPADVLDLRTFLAWAKLRPVTRQVATALQAVTGSGELRRILYAYEEDQWELPELLDLLASGGYDTTRLWRSELFQSEALARVVPPEGLRDYSISAAPPPGFPDTVELVVGPLRYEAQRPSFQEGVTSVHMAERGPLAVRDLHVDIGRTSAFRPPDDPSKPMVLVAGGTGIAPFLSFAEARAGDAGADIWLIYGARTEGDVIARKRLAALAATGRIDVTVVLSREDAQLCSTSGGLVRRDAKRSRVPDLFDSAVDADRLRRLVDTGACVYVCGRPAFAKSVRASIAEVLGTDTLRRMAGSRRFVEEVFTPFSPAHPEQLPLLDASEIALHNRDGAGRWMVINGGVYDVSELRHLHPGGHRIVDESCGTDATSEWEAVGHHEVSAVSALLETFRIGTVRRLDLGSSWAVALTREGPVDLRLEDLFVAWTRYLYGMTEMENSVRNDYAHLEMPLVQGQRSGESSAFGRMLALNTHRRVRESYFPAATGARLDELWRLTVGFVAPEQPCGWMAEAVAEATPSPQVDDLDSAPGGAANHELLRRDLGLLSGLKACARAGVIEFERHQQRVVERSGPALLDALRAIPSVVGRYRSGAGSVS